MPTPIASLDLSASASIPTATQPRIGRRVGAVLAGLIVVVLLSHATDAVLHATGVFPAYGQVMSDGLFVLALIYRSLFGVLGGYVTARLAPARPRAHAIVLGSIGTLAGLGGVVCTLDAGPEFGPQWYAVLVMLSALPCAWLGARLAKS